MGRHLVLYDGVCGLCNGIVRFILLRDRPGVFDFASLQSATGRSWLERFHRDPDALETVVVITDYQGAQPGVRVRSDAALFVTGLLRYPWRALAVLRLVPRGVRDVLYTFIARRRYRVFGRYETCLLPAPDQRQRFIDI